MKTYFIRKRPERFEALVAPNSIVFSFEKFRIFLCYFFFFPECPDLKFKWGKIARSHVENETKRV